MTDGIEGLFDVGELLNRLAKQKTLIEEQAKLLDGYLEAVEKLIRAHDEREASDKRVDALWEEMIEMTSDLAEHNRRVAEKYRVARDKQSAGGRSRHERAGELYPEALKIYRQELPRAANKKEARERTQDRMVKKYPEYRKEGRIWKDSYFRQVIAKLMK